jgi:hypothetical protein
MNSAMAPPLETTTAAGLEERQRVIDALRRREDELRARADASCAVRLDRPR